MIKKLIIENFRNISHAEYELTKSNIFEGRNNVGKTNTINALYWLLTGELLSDDLDKAKMVDTIIPETNKEAIVEVTAILESGIEIKRRYFQNWTRTRGTTEMVYQGNSTESYINNSKQKETEWLSKVLAAFGKDYTCNVKKINKVAAVVDPTYLLMKTDYKDLRAFIFEMVGGVTFEEIAKKNPKYKELEEMLRVTPAEDLRTNYKTKLNKFKEEITKKIGVIESLNNADPYDDSEYEETAKTLAEKEKQLAYLKTSAPGEVKDMQLVQSELLKELAGLTTKKNELQNQLNIALMEETQKAQNPRVPALEKEINELELKIAKIKNTGKMEQDKKATADTLRKSYAIKKMDAENDIATCRGDLNKVYSSEPEEKTCPACGCILNEEEIENFNELKETKIEKIKELIAQLEKNRDDAAAKELAQAEASSESTKKILELKRELGEAVQLEMGKEKELEEARKNKLAVDGTKSSEIRAEIAKVEEQAKDCEERLKIKNAEVLEALDKVNQEREAEYNAINTEIEELRKKRDAIAERRMVKGMLEAAQRELDKLYADQAADEVKLLLIDAFIKDKIKTLNDKASLFFGVDFVLLEEQKNGGLKETCYPVVDGIPYVAVNTSRKQEIGIKLINKLRENLELSDLPIIIDKLECLDDTNIKRIQADQLITAKVTNAEQFTLTNY
jgi:DNA repair exonuclease SbcCD ATPase subunit